MGLRLKIARFISSIFQIQLYIGYTLYRAITGNLNKMNTIKILKFGTPQTIAIIVLKIEKFDVTLH